MNNFCIKCYSYYDEDHKCEGDLKIVEPLKKHPINEDALNKLADLYASNFKSGTDKEIAQEAFIEGYERAVLDLHLCLYVVRSIKDDLDDLND